MLLLMRKVVLVGLTTLFGMALIQSAFASGGGGGGMSMPSMSESSAPLTPQQKAAMAYEAGVKLIKDADQAMA